MACFKIGSQNLPGGLRETTRNDCENNRPPSKKSNLGPTEFYAKLLTTQQLRDDEPLGAVYSPEASFYTGALILQQALVLCFVSILRYFQSAGR